MEYLRETLDLYEGLPGIVMTIHTFGEYLDCHPHLYALVADHLFVGSSMLRPARRAFVFALVSATVFPHGLHH